jgi:hypothetical protein
MRRMFFELLDIKVSFGVETSCLEHRYGPFAGTVRALTLGSGGDPAQGKAIRRHDEAAPDLSAWRLRFR